MRAIRFAWAGLLALGLTGAAHADPLKIRGAWVAPVANWASIWLEKKDLAKHFGQSYVFESVHYAGTPPMITATANNELEIADLAYSTLPIAIENAGMDDLRVVADEFQDGCPADTATTITKFLPTARSTRWRTSRARWSRPTPRAAALTSP